MSESASEKETTKFSPTYTQTKNQIYFQNRKEKIKDRAQKILEKEKLKYDAFDHSIPIAGTDGEQIKRQRKEDLKNLAGTSEEIDENDINVTLNNEKTYGGLENKKGVPYEAIKPFIKTFDLIGFHGGDGASNFIDFVQRKMSGHILKDQRSAITHTGLAFRAEDFPQDHYLHRPKDENRIYCWESTMSGPLAFDKVKNVDGSKCQFFKLCEACGCPQHLVPSVPHRFGFLGSQFRDLDNLTIRYDANPEALLVWARLDERSRENINSKMANSSNPENFILDLVANWNSISYNSTCCCIDLCAAAIPCFRILQDIYAKICPVHVGNNGSVFCSEFCARIYQQLGVLDSSVNSKQVVPSDFLTYKNKSEEILPLDSDQQVPILFRSYVQFTARSKLGKMIYLRQEFLDNLLPEPEFLDENRITEEAIDQQKFDKITKTELHFDGLQSLKPGQIPMAGFGFERTNESEIVVCEQPKSQNAY